MEEYYVVGVYITTDEVPDKIYKITTNMTEAINCYLNYWTNSKCGIGCYYKNKLINILQLRSNPVDNGPGIFRKQYQYITLEDLENYQSK